MTTLPRLSSGRFLCDLARGRFTPEKVSPYMHAAWKELGRPPAFEVAIPGNHMTVVSNPELALSFLRTEWKYPRGSAELWPFPAFYGSHSKTAGTVMPFMVSQREEWRRPRHTFQKQIFTSSQADTYLPLMDEVCDSAFAHVRSGCSPYMSGPDTINFSKLAANLTFEMLANILLGKRLGLMDGSASQSASEFVECASRGFDGVGALMQMPPAIGKLTPGFKGFVSDMKRMEALAYDLISHASPDSVFGRLQGKLSEEELTANFVTLLQGGVDTTSSTMQFQAYRIATDPRVQASLRAEFRDRGSLSVKHLPYWKAFSREVHRVCPTGSGFVRRNPHADKVVELGGESIRFAKGTMMMYSNYNTGQEEDLLHGDITRFIPERWLEKDAQAGAVVGSMKLPDGGSLEIRKPADELWHPLNFTPFSVGPRMCIGARLADRELCAVMQNFLSKFEKIELADPTYVLETKVGVVPAPKNPLMLTVSA